MNNLMVFEGHEVEVFEWKGKVLFNPYHVAECLEIKNVRDNIGKMNDNQVIKITNSDVGDSDIRKLNNAGENFLTESGVFKLIFKSHKPDAEKFQDWVTDEVLPSIGKTGIYSIKEPKVKKSTTVASINNAAKIILPQLEAAGVDPVQRTYFLKDIYESVGISVPMVRIEQEKLYEQTEIAQIVGVYSRTGKPHTQAIGAIIGKLDIDENDIVQTSFTKNGHTDIAPQYREMVVEQVKEWLEESGYPIVITGKNKEYKVFYKELETA